MEQNEYTYFHSQIKARVHQLRLELKVNNKGNKSISKYVLRIREIVYSLLAVRDPITERDQINVILQGLPNTFIMMIYYKGGPTYICYVEALLNQHEIQLDKFRQELSTPSVSDSIAQAITNHSLVEILETLAPINTLVVGGTLIVVDGME